MRLIPLACLCVVVLTCQTAHSAEDPPAETAELQTWLEKPILDPQTSTDEVKRYSQSRVPPMPAVKDVAEWEGHADRIRREVLDRVVYRGAAAGWRDARLGVEWLDTIEGGPGYKIQKLRYEVLPGLWIPALLYRPDEIQGKVPVVMNVNGHDSKGKAADYKQLRCINLAKRGVLALNVEWLGMGQLGTAGFRHYVMNQIDLCGTSGLAPFYLSMKRGLDVLLSLDEADPQRVGVAGLSGGGWQTIFISSLDTRVTLSNPVAGYSSYKTRAEFGTDLGDSEQQPVDLAVYADYAHLTALRAPRPTLLTYNAKDNCCFQAGHALPPLLEAAGPIYKLYGKEDSLRSHVNEIPGDHNFGQENREAFYRLVGDFFFEGEKGYDAHEIPSELEVKSADDLKVPLPDENADFHTLALALAKSLPREPELPASKEAATAWRESHRKKLHEALRPKAQKVHEDAVACDAGERTRVMFWKLRYGADWTIPAVELVRGEPQGTTIVIADGGRAAATAEIEKLLAAGQRVLAVDLFYFGESKIPSRDFLFGLFLSSVGDRPLGLQASQLGAIAGWGHAEQKWQPITLKAIGPRSSLIALTSAALDDGAIARVELHDSFGSLKEIIEQNRTVDQAPELFCFGLLEACDILQLAAMVAPRPVVLIKASDRARTELAPLRDYYQRLGVEHDPLP